MWFVSCQLWIFDDDFLDKNDVRLNRSVSCDRANLLLGIVNSVE